MSRDDDDLMKHTDQNDDIEFDSNADDDLAIPDTPYGNDESFDDDDLLGSVDSEDFDLGDGLDESFDSDDALDDLAEIEASDEGPEAADDEEEEDEPEQFKPGLKTYLGVGGAAIVAVLGLSVVMFGGNSTQPAQTAQPMSPERLQEISAASANNGTAQTEQVVPAQNTSSPAGSENPIHSSGENANHEPRMETAGASQQPQSTGWDDSEPVIGTPGMGREVPPGTELGEDEILELVKRDFAPLNEFKAIRGTINSHGQRISRLNENLTDTQRTVKALEDRVQKLEGRSSAASAETQGDPSTTAATEEQPAEPSEVVREAQIRLTAFNYRPGPIDGLMGNRTQQAIKRFQEQHKLDTTGELDEITLTTLESEPQRYTGSYQQTSTRSTAARTQPENREQPTSQWYVRGVTPSRAIVYQENGSSYAVNFGTEVPGFGQVTELHPEKHQVVTTRGIIGRK